MFLIAKQSAYQRNIHFSTYQDSISEVVSGLSMVMFHAAEQDGVPRCQLSNAQNSIALRSLRPAKHLLQYVHGTIRQQTLKRHSDGLIICCLLYVYIKPVIEVELQPTLRTTGCHLFSVVNDVMRQSEILHCTMHSTLTLLEGCVLVGISAFCKAFLHTLL